MISVVVGRRRTLWPRLLEPVADIANVIEQHVERVEFGAEHDLVEQVDDLDGDGVAADDLAVLMSRVSEGLRAHRRLNRNANASTFTTIAGFDTASLGGFTIVSSVGSHRLTHHGA